MANGLVSDNKDNGGNNFIRTPTEISVDGWQ